MNELFLKIKGYLYITFDMWKDIAIFIATIFGLIYNFLSANFSLIFNFLFGYLIIKVTFWCILKLISLTIYWIWRLVLYFEVKAKKLLSLNIVVFIVALIKLEYHMSNIYFKFPRNFILSGGNGRKRVYDYLVYKPFGLEVFFNIVSIIAYIYKPKIINLFFYFMALMYFTPFLSYLPELFEKLSWSNVKNITYLPSTIVLILLIWSAFYSGKSGRLLKALNKVKQENLEAVIKYHIKAIRTFYKVFAKGCENIDSLIYSKKQIVEEIIKSVFNEVKDIEKGKITWHDKELPFIFYNRLGTVSLFNDIEEISTFSEFYNESIEKMDIDPYSSGYNLSKSIITFNKYLGNNNNENQLEESLQRVCATNSFIETYKRQRIKLLRDMYDYKINHLSKEELEGDILKEYMELNNYFDNLIEKNLENLYEFKLYILRVNKLFIKNRSYIIDWLSVVLGRDK